MDRLAYIAMSGAKQTMQAQAVVSNNIANAGTTGFRAELVGAAAAPVYGDGHASRVNTVLAGYGADFASGPVKSTGRRRPAPLMLAMTRASGHLSESWPRASKP